jgi:DegV family protein with EDD domain
VRYLDGKRLRKAVNAGWLWVNKHRNRLNAINVFPVADGDTGTNMSLTLRSAVMGANSSKSDSLPDVADAIALHSLRGAQGNSGVILSQYFKGVAESVRGRRRIYVEDLPATFRAGADSAYRAVREPKEGTILTVLHDMASQAEKARSRKSVSQFLEMTIEKGRQSLESTKHKLKELARANVVDAGGQGFLHFMEGILHLIRRGEMNDAGPTLQKDLPIPASVEKQSSFRFCSEFLVKGNYFDSEAIKRQLIDLGDSLIVASTSVGDASYLRIHIHTDSPAAVQDLASALGTLEKRKVDDMQAQNLSMRRWRGSLTKRSAPGTVTIVTDSTCDLPPALAAFYGIEIVPLKVTFGDSVYHDGIDLDNYAFYKKLKELPTIPKTSQPSPDDFAAKYKEILARSDCRILSIHISSRLSGTYNSSIIAAQTCQDSREYKGRVVCFNSGTVSLGLALMTIAAAEMSQNGESLENINMRLEELKQGQGLYFTLGTLDYLIKGGRIGKARGIIGRLLKLTPLLSLVDGEVVPIAKVRGDVVLEKMISLLPRNGRDYRWAIGHADCPSLVERLTPILKERCGAEEVLAGEIGPTVGTHAGPGSWGIFYMRG